MLPRRRPNKAAKLSNEVRLIVVTGVERGSRQRGSGSGPRNRAFEAAQRSEALWSDADACQEAPFQLPFTHPENSGNGGNAGLVASVRK